MCLTLLTFLFVGQFYDHHGDKALFIKHSPSFQQVFSFDSENHLPEAIQVANSKRKERENESGIALFITSIFIGFSITFLASGSLSFFKNISFSLQQLYIPFTINFLVTFFATPVLLLIDNSLISYIFFIVLIVSNFLTTLLYNRLKIVSRKNNL